MSPDPLTPDGKPMSKTRDLQAMAVATDSDRSTAAPRMSTVTEPSPASTYGDSAESSMLATPLDAKQSDSTAQFVRAIRELKLDDKYVDATAPTSVQQSKDQKDPVTDTPTLSKNASFPETICSPHSACKRQPLLLNAQTRNVTLHGDQAVIFGAPPNLVCAYDSEDPFVSSDLEQSQQIDTVLHHPNRVGVEATNLTAQALYPPQACVFVANLCQSSTDEQLETAVAASFRQFGNVYVKIRRDSRQMPFAFAQYTNLSDAQRAITLGRGMLINGRPCRTEVARVNRSLFVSKIGGGSISIEEAQRLMVEYRPLELLWFPTLTEREMFNLSDGIFIRFAFFDDCRDAQAAFRDSPCYRVEQVKGFEEARILSSGRTQRINEPAPSYGNVCFPPKYATVRRDADARSIFVGNLPIQMTEEQVCGLFRIYGPILHCDLIRRPLHGDASVTNAFAFLEFHDRESASSAVEDGSYRNRGLNLRVAHKGVPRHASHPAPTYTVGTGKHKFPSSEDLFAAFQRGVSTGMSQAAHTQMVTAPIYSIYPYYNAYELSSVHANINPAITTTLNLSDAPGQITTDFHLTELSSSPRNICEAFNPSPISPKQSADRKASRGQYRWPPQPPVEARTETATNLA